MKKRIISILLCFCFFAAALAGCGGQTAQDLTDTDTLVIYKGQYDDYIIDPIVETFKATYPDVKLEVVDLTGLDFFSEYKPRIQSELMTGKGPDVIVSVFDFIDNTYKTAKAGTLAPLNEIFTGELALDEKEYSKNIMNACTYDGNQYFYPVALSIPCLLTTKSIMDEQKFDLEKCKTILDFLAESKKYVDQTEPRLLDRSDSLFNIVQLANLPIADYKNEKINLEDQKLHELLEGYKAIYPQEMLDRPADGMTYSSTIDAFNGLSAKKSLFHAYLYGGNLDDIAINISLLDSKGEEPVLYPMPDAFGKQQAGVSLGVGINANSKNKKNAARFIQIMLDQKNQVESSIGWPVRKSAMAERLEGQRYMAGSTIENVPLVDLTDEMVALIQNMYDSIETASFLDPFDSMLIGEMGDYLSNSDKGLEEALESARDALEILVSE